MFSLSRSKASVISRLADYLQFNVNPDKQSAVAGYRPIGGVNATQMSLGVFYPTIQGAIDDISERAEIPVGGILINDTGNEPTSISQSDRIQFTGDVIAPDGEDVMIYVFGIPVTVTSGDAAVVVASKVYAKLLDYVAQNVAFSSVEIDGTDASILNITYNDYQNRKFPESSQYGVTMSQTILVPGQASYGSWERLGTTAQTLTGGSVNGGTITLHYFKRTS